MRRRLLSGSAARRLALTGVFALALGASFAPATVRAADPRVATASGACANEWVLSSIRHRFAYGARRVENRDLEIVAVDKIRDVHVATGRPSPIPRQMCAAEVTLSDGTRSALTWVVASGLGFAGPGLAYIPDEVEFCVDGHDPWRVHDGTCRTTRKFW